MTEIPKNLMQSLLDEIERVKEIKAEYDKIPAGFFAATIMERDLKNAQEAIGTGDVSAMVRCLSHLKLYEL